MRTHTEPHQPDRRSQTLLVLLPPSLSSIEEMLSNGMVDAVRWHSLPVDVLLADITAQHVLDRTVAAALHAQVVLPARAQGYADIWMCGISMGAFCALQYAAEHPGQLAGLYLLAPYPGTGDVLGEIRAAGGAAAWHQQHAADLGDERRWWHWLCQASASGTWPTPVYFGTGSEDRFLRGQTLLSGLLPADRVRTLPGRHQWPTWNALWDDWLTLRVPGNSHPTAPYNSGTDFSST